MGIVTVTESSCTRLHLDNYPESELPKSDPVTSENKSQGKSQGKSATGSESLSAELLRHGQHPITRRDSESVPGPPVGLGRPRHSLPHDVTTVGVTENFIELHKMLVVGGPGNVGRTAS
jgi:hypothetical protein